LHVRLDRAETCIGRDPTSDVVVPDPQVPDVAAVVIDRGAMRYKLLDLTGGLIQINGETPAGEEVDLEDGMKLQLGSYELHFRVREQASPAHRRTRILGAEASPAEQPATLTMAGQVIELSTERPFNVGTDSDNDLVIEDDFISSFHCRISHQSGRWILSDLASTNGTQVNGLKVGEAELPRHATIELGRAKLVFELSDRSEESAPPLTGMIGDSSAMRRVFDMAKKIAKADAPALIIGASGSGKELVARALHDGSPRASGPFLALNCGALAATVIEGELFGHVKGAFTGAVSDKKGAFEAAHNGTIFLDEIGELPLELQPKLLRVLETSSVRRVGGTKEIPVNTRVVAATHRNLKDLVEEGSFREDLFHRLFVLTIQIPPLRERTEDVVPLAEHFLKDQGDRSLRLSSEAKRKLESYSWPGNVRELKNVILRAVLLLDGEEIGEDDLAFSGSAFESGTDVAAKLRMADEAERNRIIEVLEETGNNRAEAARILGLSKSTFHDRLKRLGVPLKFGLKRNG
jgi:DNA-binding NtrC family response regulator